MSSNNGIKNRLLLEQKPYLTRQEVGLLLEKNGRNLDKKILQLLKKKYLMTLKKGLYTSSEYVARQPPQSREYLANALYYPSYLSLEYVLQQEGILPEGVYSYTSITLKNTRVFTNPLGVFIYRNIKPSLFTGYQSVRYSQSYYLKIASRAKALFDLLYLKPMPQSLSGKKQEVLDDMRIQWELLTKQDREEFSRYVTLSQSKKMKQLVYIITRNYAA